MEYTLAQLVINVGYIIHYDPILDIATTYKNGKKRKWQNRSLGSKLYMEI